MNENFRSGFEKLAEEDNTKRNLIGAGVGAAAALGSYAMLRKPGKALSLIQSNSVQNGFTKAVWQKKPKTGVGRFVDRLLHGADNVSYINPNRVPNKPKNTKATVFHTETFGKDHIKGSREIGSGRDVGVKKFHERKDQEMKLLDQIEPNRIKTVYPDKAYQGKSALPKLQKEFKQDNFFIKGNDDAATGVGGGGFVSGKDLKKIEFDPKRIKEFTPQKQKILKRFMKTPEKFTVQKDMKIEKDLLGNNKEFRVHVMGDKIVAGASSPRGGNVTGLLKGEQGKAEKHLQKVLDKLPPEYRNMAMAADIAKTKNGFKIVELNAGTGASGFLDHKFLNKKAPGVGLVTAAKNNQAVYKTMTGRASQLESGTKGLAAGAAAGSGAIGLQKYKKKEEEQPKATLP